MKPLYNIIEGVLDIDTSKIEQVTNKALWNQLNIDVKGTEKNPSLHFAQIKLNDDGEITICCWARGGGLGTVNSPRLDILFPDGVSIEKLQFTDRAAKTQFKLSDVLNLGVKLKTFCLSSNNTEISKLDTNVEWVDCSSIIVITKELIQAASKYTHKLSLDASMELSYWQKMDYIKTMVDCPMDVLIIEKGAYLFGLDRPRRNTTTIADYLKGNLKRNGETISQWTYRNETEDKAYRRFKSELTNLIKDNPKTKIIMSWGKTMEVINLDSNGDLVATKITEREINKL